MNTFDIILTVIIGFFLIKGLFRGLIIEVFTLLGLVFAYIVATKEMNFAAMGISRLIDLPPALLMFLSFSLIFLLIVIVARIFAGALERLIRKTPATWLNHGAGGLFGLFKGTLIASLLALLTSILPLSGSMAKHMEDSFLYKPMLLVAPAVFNFAQQHFPEAKTFVEEMREVVESQTESVKRSLFQKQLDSLEQKLQNTVSGELPEADLENIRKRLQ